jgi:DNA-binding PadR family transcriptional regulator
MAELIEKGFAFRDDVEGRRYKQKYRLTEEGKRAAEDVSGCVKRIEDAVNKNLTAAQLESFFDTLEILCDNLAALKDGTL